MRKISGFGRAVFVVLVGAGLFAISPASAADNPSGYCPDATLASVMETYIALDEPNPNIPAGVAAIDSAAAQCKTDPYIQRLAAVLHVRLATGDDKVTARYEQAVKALDFAQAMRASMPASTGSTRRSLTIRGQQMVTNNDDANDVMGAAMEAVFDLEGLTYKPIPGHAPLAKGEKPGPCGPNDAVDVEHAYDYIEQVVDQPSAAFAVNFIERRVVACEAEIAKGTDRKMLALRAKINLYWAARNIDLPEAKAKLEKAKADSDRYVALNGGFSLDWSQNQDISLHQRMSQVK